VEAGRGELQAHRRRLEAGNDQEHEPADHVHDPESLWSTVTTQSWSTASNGRRVPAPRLDAIVSASTLMSSLPSPQGQEVSGHFVQVVARELHGRHERARLQGCRIVDPGSNILRVFWITPAPMVRRLIR